MVCICFFTSLNDSCTPGHEHRGVCRFYLWLGTLNIHPVSSLVFYCFSALVFLLPVISIAKFSWGYLLISLSFSTQPWLFATSTELRESGAHPDIQYARSNDVLRHSRCGRALGLSCFDWGSCRAVNKSSTVMVDQAGTSNDFIIKQWVGTDRASENGPRREIEHDAFSPRYSNIWMNETRLVNIRQNIKHAHIWVLRSLASLASSSKTWFCTLSSVINVHKKSSAIYLSLHLILLFCSKMFKSIKYC